MPALFALYCAWFANTGEGWVHVLDGANLAFHEAGHPIFGMLLGSGSRSTAARSASSRFRSW